MLHNSALETLANNKSNHVTSHMHSFREMDGEVPGLSGISWKKSSMAEISHLFDIFVQTV